MGRSRPKRARKPKRANAARANTGCLTAVILGSLALGLFVAIGIPVAVGVGLWLLMRYIWRRAVAEDPENPLVKKALGLAPIWREALAGAFCVVVALGLIGAIGSGAGSGGGVGSGGVRRPTDASSGATVEQTAGQSSDEADDEASSQSGEVAEPDEAGCKLEVVFIDVGQGQAILLELPDGKTMLVDAGPRSSESAVEAELASRNVARIDYLVATHADSDHIGGMEEVVGAHEVGEFLTPQTTHTTDTYLGLLQAIADKGVATTAAWAGEEVVADGECSVEILSPVEGQEYTESNDWSVVLLVTYGKTRMLLTGDAPKEILKSLDVGPVDVLGVSHHGSNTGTDAELVGMLSPKFSIISYGLGNDYGHPTSTVLSVLASTTVYGTGANGTVTAESDGESYTVSGEKVGAVVAGDVAEGEGSGAEDADASGDAGAAETAAPMAAQPSQSDATDASAEETVVTTPKGKRYHRRGCRTLSRSKNLIERTKSEAEGLGLTACGVCNP